MKEKPIRPEHKRPVTKNEREEAADAKATRFDGNPNPVAAASDTFKPKDDTPLRLEKKKGSKP